MGVGWLLPCVIDLWGAAGDADRIFGAHAAHLRCCDLRYSLTHPRMRALRYSARPLGPPRRSRGRDPWTPNLSAGPPVTPPEMSASQHMFQANGLRFRAMVDGPSDGEMFLLLHGFPEGAESWSPQLDA